MNFKIIETGSEYPDVLITRDRNDAGEEIIKIIAFGTVEDTEDQIAEEIIVFYDNANSAQRFVIDYSEKSAELWCQEKGILYYKKGSGQKQ